jgi:hypothetical protein
MIVVVPCHQSDVAAMCACRAGWTVVRIARSVGCLGGIGEESDRGTEWYHRQTERKIQGTSDTRVSAGGEAHAPRGGNVCSCSIAVLDASEADAARFQLRLRVQQRAARIKARESPCSAALSWAHHVLTNGRPCFLSLVLARCAARRCSFVCVHC